MDRCALSSLPAPTPVAAFGIEAPPSLSDPELFPPSPLLTNLVAPPTDAHLLFLSSLSGTQSLSSGMATRTLVAPPLHWTITIVDLGPTASASPWSPSCLRSSLSGSDSCSLTPHRPTPRRHFRRRPPPEVAPTEQPPDSRPDRRTPTTSSTTSRAPTSLSESSFPFPSSPSFSHLNASPDRASGQTKQSSPLSPNPPLLIDEQWLRRLERS